MNIIYFDQFSIEQAVKGCAVIGMPEEYYHSFDAISNSGLTRMKRSPAHYKAGFGAPTNAMRFGTAVHMFLLENDRFYDHYAFVDAKDKRCKEWNQAKKDFDPERLMLRKECDAIEKIGKNVFENSDVAEYFKDVLHTELSLFATDPVTGMLVKCRFDLLAKGGRALDIKKTQDVRAEKFSKSVRDYGYYQQQAFYDYVYFLVTGFHLESFEFLAIEEKAPHSNKLFFLDDMSVALGEKHYREALNEYAACKQQGEWGGIVQERECISLPDYMIDEICGDMGEEVFV